MSRPGSAKSNRKRAKLHVEQQGRCFYCRFEIGVFVDDPGNPVLEHYIPHSLGGTRVVLACQSCDKVKGMIQGPEFEAIIAGVVAGGEFTAKARQEIGRLCKIRNRDIQTKHEPRRVGLIKTAQRTIQRAQRVGITVTDYPVLKAFTTVGESARIPGNSGRDAFIEQWKGATYMNAITDGERPHTGDRHYEGWTGKHPA
jgi:hypothetical protein